MVFGALDKKPKSRKLQSKCHKIFGHKKIRLWRNFMMNYENARKKRNNEIVFGLKEESLGIFLNFRPIRTQTIFGNLKALDTGTIGYGIF